jgi:hypothetical protein
MARSDQLLHVMAASVRAGGGIQSTAELAVMMGVPCDSSFRKFLADQVKAGRLRRLVRGYYESVLTPPDPFLAIYQLVRKLRRGFLTYISLESQLSDTAEISQIIMGRVTLMTRGRAGCFETPYGVLELTHTKKPIARIMPNLYFDPAIKMYRANREQAIEDLKACRRNLHMLER